MAISARIGRGVSNIGNGVYPFLDAFLSLGVAHDKYLIQGLKNAFDKEQKLFEAHMEMSNVVASNIITTITSFASQTALEASRAMSKGASAEANARIKLLRDTYKAELEFNVAEDERKLELQNIEIDKIAATISGIGNISTGIGQVSGVVGGVATVIGGAAGALGSIGLKVKAWRAQIVELDIAKEKQELEVYDKLMSRVTAVADKMKNFQDALDSAANTYEDKMLANETVYKQAGLAYGFTGDTYSKYMREMQVKLSETFNIKPEEIKQMNEGFENASGRTMIMGQHDYENMTAASRLYGVGQGEIASAVGEMNIFNMSVEHLVGKKGILSEMYGKLNKIGLSTSKFVKDLTANLKLAQKYNFKGGVDNMAQLTKWAEKTRFNLQNATAFADKMMSNNISDVLETSSKLQVLGGAAGIFSDPIAMMWEAGNDVGALAKRQAAMFSDLTGTLNRKTGETQFTEYELRMIKARSEAMGMNYEDALNQIRQSNKQGVINKVLRGTNLSEDEKNGIGQRAVYENGKWVVNTLEGKKDIGQVAAMSREEREKILMPENEKEAVFDIAKDTRSIAQLNEAQTEMLAAFSGLNLWDTIEATTDKVRKAQYKQVTDSDYQQELKNSLHYQADNAVAISENTIKFIKEHGKELQNYRDFVQQELGKETALGAEEVTLLSIIAADNGIEKLSNVYKSISEILAEPDKDKRKKAYDEKMRDRRLNQDAKDIVKIVVGDGGMLNIKDEFMSFGHAEDDEPVGDAIGNTNGGYIVGSTVTPINDGIGSLVKTNKNDQYIAAKSGGPIDKMFDLVSNIISNQGTNNGGPLKIEFSGNINLNDGSSNINIIDMLKNDSVASREFIRFLVKAMDNASSGKTTKNHYI